jgi:hypothetical protein
LSWCSGAVPTSFHVFRQTSGSPASRTLAGKYLPPGEDFPADGGAPSLLGDDEIQERILQPGELSSTPKVSLPREVTRISGPVLDEAALGGLTTPCEVLALSWLKYGPNPFPLPPIAADLGRREARQGWSAAESGGRELVSERP